MRNWSCGALMLALVFAPFARADEAPPPPRKPTYPLVVEAGPKVAEARLIIPKKMLGVLKGGLDGNSSDQRASLPALHTMIAGGALAVGLAFGGLWLVRRGNAGSRSLAILIGAVAFLGIGAFVWADLAVPKPVMPAATDKVIIEVVDQGDEVKLIINKDKLAKVVKDNAK
jgi:hypothetical protein